MSAQLCNVRWEVGAHLPFCKEIAPSLSEAIYQGMYSMQVFMGNPKSFTRQCIDEEGHTSVSTFTKKVSHAYLHAFPLHRQPGWKVEERRVSMEWQPYG